MYVQGDALFALFSGAGSVYRACAAAVTMRTITQKEIAERLKQESITDWTLACAIGIDRKPVMVRRLGLRSTKMNEVWAGKPVNMAAGLSSMGNDNEIVVSDRVYACFQSANAIRRRAIIYSCGCGEGPAGEGLDAAEGTTPNLWRPESIAQEKFDFDTVYRLGSAWCATHGAEFCQAIVDGKRPS